MENLLKTRRAYAELDEFLDLLDDNDKNKIPGNVREFFKNEKDKDYIKHIDKTRPIGEQNLSEETLALIAILYLKYICTDENEKSRLRKIYAENERKYQEEIKEKYNPEKALKRKNEVRDEQIGGKLNLGKNENADESIYENANNSTDNIQTNKKEVIERKESFIKRLINKIKQFLNRK